MSGAVTIGSTIYTQIKFDTTLQTYLGGAGATIPRVYPETVPLSVTKTFPYVTYQIVSNVPLNTKGHKGEPGATAITGPRLQRSPIDTIRVQVSCFSRTYKEASEIAYYIRLALDRAIGSGYTVGSGPVIDSIIYEGVTTQYEKDIKQGGVYHFAQDFMVRTINTYVDSGFSSIYSIEFDGVDSWMDVGDKDIFSFGDGSTDSPFSLSCWIRPDAIANNTILLGKNSGTGTEEYELRFGTGGSGNGLRFRLYDASAGKYIQVRLDVFIPTSSWSHIVATYDGSGEASGINIYVDSVIPFSTELDQAGYVAMENTAAPFSMGTLGGQGGMTFYNGYMDEVAMFDIALSDTQVAAIYNSGTPATLSGHTGLIGWWRMGESGSYPTINDSSTNNNTATMTNMTSADITTVTP